jgi:hypothetical protein
MRIDRSFDGLQAALDTLLSAMPPRGKKTRADWRNSKQVDWSDSKYQRDACSAGLPSIIRTVTASWRIMPSDAHSRDHWLIRPTRSRKTTRW